MKPSLPKCWEDVKILNEHLLHLFMLDHFDYSPSLSKYQICKAEYDKTKLTVERLERFLCRLLARRAKLKSKMLEHLLEENVLNNYNP